MPPRAVLIDVYETILTCDFSAHREELPRLAGIEPALWNSHAAGLAPQLTDGRLSLHAAYRQLLLDCGGPPDSEMVARLVACDKHFLVRNTRLFDDTLHFMQRLRDRGIKSALVSNCTDNTRPMLEKLGVADLVDAVVLSCEVGAAKPEPAIYLAALRDLDTAPEDALFVDDQQLFCQGAVDVGMAAVQVNRAEVSSRPTAAVKSLLEIPLGGP